MVEAFKFSRKIMAIVLRPHRQLDEKGAIKLRKKLEKVATSSEFESHTSWIVDLSEIQRVLMKILGIVHCPGMLELLAY